MRYKVGDKISLKDGRIGVVIEARPNIAGEEYEVKIGNEIVGHFIEDKIE